MGIARRVLLALALTMSVAVAAPAAPAGAFAGQQVRICIHVGDFGDLPVFDCFWVVLPELAPNPPGPIECLSCPPTFDIRGFTDPKIREVFVDRLGKGMWLLSAAELTKDPAEYKRLRAQATEAFLSSAEMLDTPLKLAGVGWADLKNGKFFADSTESEQLKAAGVNLVAGVEWLRPVAGDPTPQPNIEAGMAAFDESLKNLTGLYGG